MFLPQRDLRSIFVIFVSFEGTLSGYSYLGKPFYGILNNVVFFFPRNVLQKTDIVFGSTFCVNNRVYHRSLVILRGVRQNVCSTHLRGGLLFVMEVFKKSKRKNTSRLYIIRFQSFETQRYVNEIDFCLNKYV